MTSSGPQLSSRKPAWMAASIVSATFSIDSIGLPQTKIVSKRGENAAAYRLIAIHYPVGEQVIITA
jgi:hypothetical protein